MDGCSRWTLISISTSYRCFTHSLFIRANYCESNRRFHFTVPWLESDITDAGQTFLRGDTMRNTMCAQKVSLYCPSHPGFYQTYSESNRASCCVAFPSSHASAGTRPKFPRSTPPTHSTAAPHAPRTESRARQSLGNGADPCITRCALFIPHTSRQPLSQKPAS
jgi:hypothetical protein